ncbi:MULTISPECIES: type II toxin-antitoxin system HipA family toxin [unclassified Vibrio]|uniref:type II toxin-antitoxin system HipA family toxin n=1 Tax=Vibrio TaxID=662 RepID=UPI001A8FB0B3|nr:MULTISPECIES: type II toxin-antitoxin system HipA family toxin [unclassified Vibrio]MBO0208778.1 type II toxin-antitoxin system HipA family toxin [Vibrio sp. Vb0877]MDW1646042.1 type II toxin-antitoxin system HipA family toxin [Vibrio sp. Vb2976]MDW1851738.1 type II toxin-antitoxin system HipA family toxin [Vibrio sp. Vb0888]
MQELVAYMNGELVGRLHKQTNGAHSFKYDPSWIDSDKVRPLSLSLKLQLNSIKSDAVINYFDNLLPDDPKVRDRIVARYKAASKQPFDLLKEVGRDSVGAISLLLPDQPYKKEPLSYEILDENKLENVLLAYKSDIPLGMLEEEDDFRISVAGAQEKTALLRFNEQWCIPKGNTPTTHIIKLPIGEIQQAQATLDLTDSVENEFLCIELARELGFEVPNVEIIQTSEVKALAVERFDRRWNRDKTKLLRLPQEDICQVKGMPSSIKYESQGGPGIAEIMALLMGSNNAIEDQYNFMKFQVFQWAIGATDGHAKNFSIFIEKGGNYRLTPFYDILSAYPVLGGRGLNIRKLKLAMGLKATKGKKYEISKVYPRHFIDTAKHVGFDQEKMQSILDEMQIEMPKAIERLKSRLPKEFPTRIADSIFNNSLNMVAKLKLGS